MTAKLWAYLKLLERSERGLADAFHTVADRHADEPDIYHLLQTFAQESERHGRNLGPHLARFVQPANGVPSAMQPPGLTAAIAGPLGLLHDLQSLHLLASHVQSGETMAGQAARALRDEALLSFIGDAATETQRQITWLNSRMKEAAPQALIVGG
jgi:hypothetical protein